MTSLDALRNEIIGKLLATTDASFLAAINRIMDSNNDSAASVRLTSEQRFMLSLSDEDIRHGRTKTQGDLNKEDLKWLTEL